MYLRGREGGGEEGGRGEGRREGGEEGGRGEGRREGGGRGGGREGRREGGEGRREGRDTDSNHHLAVQCINHAFQGEIHVQNPKATYSPWFYHVGTKLSTHYYIYVALQSAAK